MGLWPRVAYCNTGGAFPMHHSIQLQYTTQIPYTHIQSKKVGACAAWGRTGVLYLCMVEKRTHFAEIHINVHNFL
jgi:hypothetical protein